MDFIILNIRVLCYKNNEILIKIRKFSKLRNFCVFCATSCSIYDGYSMKVVKQTGEFMKTIVFEKD